VLVVTTSLGTAATITAKAAVLQGSDDPDVDRAKQPEKPSSVLKNRQGRLLCPYVFGGENNMFAAGRGYKKMIHSVRPNPRETA
jgi:hypothetical protein